MAASDIENDIANPVLQEKVNNLTKRHAGLHALLVSTSDGVPLIRVIKSLESEEMPYDYAETVLPTVFAAATEQVGKLSFGNVQSITSFVGESVLIHFNDLPLVITLIADGKSASIASLRSLLPKLKSMFADFKSCVDSADSHS